jgi:hypothetical protein
MSGKPFFLALFLFPAMISARDPGFGEGLESTAENWAPLGIGGSRFFFCLIAGVLLAFAFQWLLSSLSLAAGISSLRRTRRAREPAEDARSRDDWPRLSAGSTGLKIGTKGALWTLCSACISLFFATFAAAALIRFGTPRESVILGLTIWAGFLAATIWLDSKLFGAVSGGIIGVFKAGLRGLEPPLEAFEGESGRSAQEDSALITKVREEFRSRGRRQGVRESLRRYVESMGEREPDRFEIDREANGLFEDEDLREMARRGDLQRVDRNRFREMIASRGDITEEESGQWADALTSRWNGLRAEAVGTEPGSAVAGEALSAAAVEAEGSAAAAEGGARGAKGETAVIVPVGFKERLQGFKEFLKNSDRRELNPVRLEQEVETLVLSPVEEVPEAGEKEKGPRSMKRDEVVQVLKQRRDISPQEADSIADLIDSARTRTLSRSEMREHRMQEATDRAVAKLRDRVYALKRPARDYDGFRQDVERILEDPGVDFETLKTELQGLDHQSLVDMFFSKRGVSKQDAERMAESAGSAIANARETAGQIEVETRRRIEESRLGAAARTEAAGRMVSTAAWWMFGISLATGAASALGGWMGARF